MDCFKIEWFGFYSLNVAKNRPEARKLGLYAVYKPASGKRVLWYIGKAKEIGSRLNQHIQEWQQVLAPKQMEKLSVTIGVIDPLEGSRISPTQLNDIESLFRHEYKPKRNDKSTMKGYGGRSIFVISTGKTGGFNKITAHNKPLLKLIKDNLPTRSRPSNSYPF
jgi:hypothetical protein